MTKDDGIRDMLRGLPVFAGPLAEFDPKAAPAEPEELFVDWLGEAIEAGVHEPHAMTVATVDADGAPSARILILKDFTSEGWWFAGTTTSAKGRELAGNPRAALLFFWGAQGRQVRIRGSVELAGPRARAADFTARPLEGRVAGLHGRQSQPLADLADIHTTAEGSRARLEADPGLAPDNWGLYCLSATEVEFWQADPDRRHTRLRYRRAHAGSPWRSELLWP
ncbi:pyridoxamine 5'-phosphate oxidase [Nocardiopsis terrae]|uniref:Pyridoxamine 5'-phosphate oxidase n=1 Tax=Nocardiopsis terrae TaxID=372655 RepID=A0ABR9HFC0_9ACTN|nr:pyridoxal 5'-phosphate synthase [Nocardiopsis terrae]MBE1457731.1 pyridoxamine 5'-phosphate oxidase [Nocardiopsis terrae]GHC84559.1 pyridoxamine 5'-phosphate oxidase [Nocardiopsis terrae]